jgi:hypothetical protein
MNARQYTTRRPLAVEAIHYGKDGRNAQFLIEHWAPPRRIELSAGPQIAAHPQDEAPILKLLLRTWHGVCDVWPGSWIVVLPPDCVPCVFSERTFITLFGRHNEGESVFLGYQHPLRVREHRARVIRPACFQAPWASKDSLV